MTPTISIVIPGFNATWCIPQLTQCLRRCISDDVEIIFVDDGSTDGCADLFQRLLPGARVLRQSNQGVGAARNFGVREAQSSFIQILDADDTIEPGKLRTQVDHLLKTNTDVVYSDWRMCICRGGSNIMEPVVEACSQSDCIESLLAGWWFPNSAAMFRKSAYLKSGGCDASLRNTCEDFHLWVQLAIHGASFSYLPGYFANYHRYEDRTTMSHVNRHDFFAGEAKIITNALATLAIQGNLISKYKCAAAKRLHSVARNVYRFDQVWYRELIRQVRDLDPNFSAQGSRMYRRIASIFGLGLAESLSLRLATIKGSINSTSTSWRG
jgi:glycosyltransferase involved in cell wall biosynthesis